MKILEVDQWTSTGNITNYSFDEIAPENITGGDSAAAKAIFGGHFRIKDVDENARPSIGNVWFREGATGKLEKWKWNYDSSD